MAETQIKAIVFSPTCTQLHVGVFFIAISSLHCLLKAALDHRPMHRLLIMVVDTLIGFQPKSTEVFQAIFSLYQSKEFFFVDIYLSKSYLRFL
jgi:hypothetical protein